MDLNKNQLLTEIEAAKKRGDFDEMLRKTQEAVRYFPQEKALIKALHKAQAYYVHEKLESKLLDKLEEKEDWLGLQAIYLKLLSVFPESKELQKLLKKVKDKIQTSAMKEREAYFEKAYKEILALMEAKKWADAERACYEILSYEPQKTRFINLLAKIQNLIDKEIEKELSFYYKTAIPELKKEYQLNKEQFVKV